MSATQLAWAQISNTSTLGVTFTAQTAGVKLIGLIITETPNGIPSLQESGWIIKESWDSGTHSGLLVEKTSTGTETTLSVADGTINPSDDSSIEVFAVPGFTNPVVTTYKRETYLSTSTQNLPSPAQSPPATTGTAAALFAIKDGQTFDAGFNTGGTFTQLSTQFYGAYLPATWAGYLDFTDASQLSEYIACTDTGSVGVSFMVFVTEQATGDTTPPTFSAGPSANTPTTVGHILSATLNEAGTIYAVRLANGATAPTSAQVKAGTDASDVTVENHSVAASAGVSASVTFTGGSENTAYDYYVVAEDAVPNIQTSPTLVTATTSPVFSLTASITLSVTPAATIAWALIYALSGSVTTSVTPQATLAYTPPTYSLSGDITTSVTPVAALFYTPPTYSLTGDITTSVTPQATLAYTAPTYSLTSNISVSVIPQATFGFSQGSYSMTGDVTVSVTPQATITYTPPTYSLAGDVTVGVTPQATITYTPPTYSLAGGVTVSVTPQAAFSFSSAGYIGGQVIVTVTPQATITYTPPTYAMAGSTTVTTATVGTITFSSPHFTLAGSTTVSVTPQATFTYDPGIFHGSTTVSVTPQATFGYSSGQQVLTYQITEVDIDPVTTEVDTVA